MSIPAAAALAAPGLEIGREGRVHVLQARQELPVARDAVFPFFADARNLVRITPPAMQFRIVTPSPIHMRDGALIDYRLRVAGVSLGWRTRITRWRPPHEFTDEQLRGPYAEWVHTHRFTELGPDRTLMEDTVRFRLPFGPLGLVAAPLVRLQLRAIFEFRRRAIAQLLPKLMGSPAAPEGDVR